MRCLLRSQVWCASVSEHYRPQVDPGTRERLTAPRHACWDILCEATRGRAGGGNHEVVGLVDAKRAAQRAGLGGRRICPPQHFPDASHRLAAAQMHDDYRSGGHRVDELLVELALCVLPVVLLENLGGRLGRGLPAARGSVRSAKARTACASASAQDAMRLRAGARPRQQRRQRAGPESRRAPGLLARTARSPRPRVRGPPGDTAPAGKSSAPATAVELRAGAARTHALVSTPSLSASWCSRTASGLRMTSVDSSPSPRMRRAHDDASSPAPSAPPASSAAHTASKRKREPVVRGRAAAAILFLFSSSPLSSSWHFLQFEHAFPRIFETSAKGGPKGQQAGLAGPWLSCGGQRIRKSLGQASAHTTQPPRGARARARARCPALSPLARAGEPTAAQFGRGARTGCNAPARSPQCGCARRTCACACSAPRRCAPATRQAHC